MTLDELIGHTTAIGEVTRESGAVIGTSLKTIYSRLTTMDDSVDVLKSVGISVKKLSGEMKPASEILDELGAKWSSLSKEQQQNLGVTLAGRYQLSRFLTLMQQYQQSQKASETAVNSQGSAMRENEKYLQSFEAKLNQMKNAWTEFSLAMGEALLNNGIVAFAESMATLSKFASDTVNVFGILPPLLSLATLAMLRFNKSIYATMSKLPTITAGMYGLEGALATLKITANACWGAFKGFFGFIGKAIPLMIAVSVASFAIEKLFNLIMKQKEATKKAKEEQDKMTDAYTKNRKTVKELTDEYEKLANNHNRSHEEDLRYLEVQQELSKIIPNLTNYVDENGKAHLVSANAVKEEIKQLEFLRGVKADETIGKLTEKLKENNKQLDESARKLEIVKALNESDTTGKPTKPKVYGFYADDGTKDSESSQKKTEYELNGLYRQRVAIFQEIAKEKIYSLGLSSELTDAEKKFINTQIEQHKNLVENADKQDDMIAKTEEIITKLANAKDIVGEGFDFNMLFDVGAIKDVTKVTNEQWESLKSIQDEINKGGIDWSSYREGLEKAGFDHAQELMNRLIMKKNELDKALEKGIYLDGNKKQQITDSLQLADAIANETELYDEEGNAITDLTNVFSDLNEVKWESISNSELLLGVTEDQIKKTKEAIRIMKLLAGQTNLTSEQTQAQAWAEQQLVDTFPQYRYEVDKNLNKMSNEVTMWDELNGVSEDTLADMKKNMSNATLTLLNNTNARIELINKEIEALSTQSQAYLLSMANEEFNSDPNFVNQQQTFLNNYRRLQELKAELADDTSIKNKIYNDAFVDDKNKKDGKDKNGKDKYVTDKYKQAIEELEVDLNDLTTARDNYNETSQPYRDSVQEEIDITNDKIKLTKDEISNLNKKRDLEAKSHGTKNNQEYDNLVSAIAELEKEKTSLTQHVKELNTTIYESIQNEIIQKAEQDFTALKEKMDDLNRRFSLADEKRTDILIVLNKEKLKLLVEQKKESKANYEHLKNLSKTLKGQPDLLKKNQDEMKKWLAQTRDLEVEIHDITEALVEQRESQADVLVDAMKQYYEAMKKAELDALDSSQDALEKAHDKNMDRLDKELKAYTDSVDEKIKANDRLYAKEDYDKNLKEEQAKAQKIQDQINALALDTSIEGMAKKAELQKELDEQNKSIEDMQTDRSRDLEKQGLEDDKEAKNKYIENEKENAKYQVKINGKVYEDTYDNLVKFLEKEKEETEKKWTELLENEKYWGKVRADILAGNVDGYIKILEKYQKNVGKNMETLGKNVAYNLTKTLGDARKEISKITGDIKKEVKEIVEASEKATNTSKTKAPNSTKSTTPSTTKKTDETEGSTGQGGKSTKVNASSLPLRKKSGGFPAPKGGWNPDSVQDYLKSKSYYADFPDRVGLYKSLKGNGEYEGTPDQNNWLLQKLKTVSGLKTGGFTGDWQGDGGKLAFLHKKELVLNDGDTKNLLGTIKLLDSITSRINLDSLKTPSLLNPSVVNNYNLNLRIDNVTGDKDGGEQVFATLVKGLKKLGK